MAVYGHGTVGISFRVRRIVPSCAILHIRIGQRDGIVLALIGLVIKRSGDRAGEPGPLVGSLFIALRQRGDRKNRHRLVFRGVHNIAGKEIAQPLVLPCLTIFGKPTCHRRADRWAGCHKRAEQERADKQKARGPAEHPFPQRLCLLPCPAERRRAQAQPFSLVMCGASRRRGDLLRIKRVCFHQRTAQQLVHITTHSSTPPFSAVPEALPFRVGCA